MNKKLITIILCFIFLANTFCLASGEEMTEQTSEGAISGDVIVSDNLSGESFETENSGLINNASGSTIENLSGESGLVSDEPIKKEVPKFVKTLETLLMIYIFFKTCEHIKEAGKVFKIEPVPQIKYCKDVPIEGMTVGQAVFIKDTELMKTSNVFLGNLLSLKQKGNIDLVARGGDVCYKILDVEPNVFVEEKDVYNFLKMYSKKFSRSDGFVSLRSLQKIMLKSSDNVAHLKNNINDTLKKSLLYYDDELNKRIFKRIKDIVLYAFIWIIALIIHGNHFGIFDPHTWIMLLSMINIALCVYIAQNTVVFDEVGMQTREKVKAFQRYMLNFSSSKEAGVPELEVWEKNLNFALGFGVVEKVIEQMKSSYPNFAQTALARECLLCQRLIGLQFNKCFINAISFKNLK